VDHLDSAGGRGSSAGSIEFDAVQFNLRSFGQLMKRRSGPGAGIDRAGSAREIKHLTEARAFNKR
jgi:hypothetical protein